MDYEELSQWRDICEELNQRWYKFLNYNYVPFDFKLLLPGGKERRHWLYYEHRIRLVAWCWKHPASRYRSLSRSEEKTVGWQLISGWEVKIDFLEKVYLLNENPHSLSMPWRNDEPLPYDVVLGGGVKPQPNDAVLSPQYKSPSSLSQGIEGCLTHG